MTIPFYNSSPEDFTHTWNKIPKTIKKGETVEMEAPLAEHFAKHLAMRELNREKKNVVQENIDALIKGYLRSIPESQEPELLKKVFCEFCDSKGVKHKKECPSILVKEPQVGGMLI